MKWGNFYLSVGDTFAEIFTFVDRARPIVAGPFELVATPDGQGGFLFAAWPKTGARVGFFMLEDAA